MEDTRQKRETWYENGKLKYKENYKNGKKVPLPPRETTLYNNQKI